MRASEVTLEWLQEHLSGMEGSGNQWQAWCPCHDDEGTTRKGLSCTKKNGRWYCKCWSCSATLTDIVKTVEEGGASNGASPNITVRARTRKDTDVSGSGGMGWWVEKTGVTQDVWDDLGCIERGSGVAFTFAGFSCLKIRSHPKGFQWVGTDAAEAPPLWPIPTDDLPEHIWITESESDCGTANAAGNVAYAATKGSKGAIPASVYEALRSRGCNEITFAGDADEPGGVFNLRESSKALAAGFTCNTVRLETVVDAFSGINDLNSVWRACETIEEYQTVIERATERVASRFRISTVDELEEVSKEDIPWLIPDLIAPSDKILVAGPPKAYKTYITLDMIRCLTDGGNFLQRNEWEVTKPARGLFIEEEGSRQQWGKRVHRLALQNRKHILFLHRQGIRFTDPSTIDSMIALVHEHELDYAVFDPLQRMIPGVNENDSSETGIVWDEIMRMQLACPELVCIILHHSAKGVGLGINAPRGSSRHSGEVDLLVTTEKVDTGIVNIQFDGRDIPEYMGSGDSFEAKVEITDEHLKINANEIDVTVSPVKRMAQRNQTSLLQAIAEGAHTFQLMVSATGLGESTVRRQLKTAIEEKHVVEHDHGKGKAKTYDLSEDDGQEKD